MTNALDSRALNYACQRVEDFALVNKQRSTDEKQDAVNLWLDHLGLDESLKQQFCEWLERFIGPGWDGAVMIGLAVGLYVNQYNFDNP